MRLLQKVTNQPIGDITPSENELAFDEMVSSLGGYLCSPYLEDMAQSPMAVRICNPQEKRSRLRGDVLLFFQHTRFGLNHVDKKWLDWAYSQNAGEKKIKDIERYVERQLFSREANDAQREAEAIKAITQLNAVQGIPLRSFEEEFYVGVFPLTEANRNRTKLIHDADKVYRDIRDLPSFFVRYHAHPKISVPGREDFVSFSYPIMQEESNFDLKKLREVSPFCVPSTHPSMGFSSKITHGIPGLAVAGLIRSAIRQYLDGSVF